MATTPKGAPYPVGSDLVVNGDNAIQALAEWVDARPGIAVMTTAERNALTGADLWTGRKIYNTTESREEHYNGSAWVASNPTSEPIQILAPAMRGSSVLGTVGAGWWTARLYDPATGQGADAVITIPSGWATVDVDVWWTNAGAGAGNVVWDCRLQAKADGAAMTGPTYTPVTIAAPAQDVTKKSTLRTGVAVTAGGLLLVNLNRAAADAADTLGNNAGVMAIAVRKAS